MSRWDLKYFQANPAQGSSWMGTRLVKEQFLCDLIENLGSEN